MARPRPPRHRKQKTRGPFTTWPSEAKEPGWLNPLLLLNGSKVTFPKGSLQKFSHPSPEQACKSLSLMGYQVILFVIGQAPTAELPLIPTKECRVRGAKRNQQHTLPYCLCIHSVLRVYHLGVTYEGLLWVQGMLRWQRLTRPRREPSQEGFFQKVRSFEERNWQAITVQ